MLDGAYKPYQKPGNALQFIHKESNDLPNIIKQVPVTIETRLSNHLSNETVFRHAGEVYEKTLKKIKSQCQVTVKTHKSEYKQQNKSQKKY